MTHHADGSVSGISPIMDASDPASIRAGTDALLKEMGLPSIEVVSVQDYEESVTLLLQLVSGYRFPHEPIEAPGVIGQRWLNRAAEHLAQKLDRSFRETPRINTEQQALAMVKGIAQELDKAASALKAAAESLKGASKVSQANQAYRAHMYARDVAKQWLPEGGPHSP